MSEEKKVVATDLASIPPDILEQAKPAETKPEDKTMKIKVKRLEVREKAEPPAQPKSEVKPAEDKPVEAKPAVSALTMTAVEKELTAIKLRLGVVETAQAAADARLKAIEATQASVADSLQILTDLQAKASTRLDDVEVAIDNTAKDAKAALTTANEAKAEAKSAAGQVDLLDKQQRVVADGVLEVRRRQTPWGMFAAWREARRKHAAAERATMAMLKEAEYQASLQAVADGKFQPSEA